MLFQPEHLKLIKKGKKTQTRRIWKRKMVKEGGVYAAHNSEKGIFQRKEDAPFFIRVKKVWKEQLGDISESDAIAEGAKNREEFKRVWKQINGSWDPEQEVFVVKFEVEENP